MPEADWPTVVDRAIARLPEENYSYVFLAILIAVVVVALPFIRKLIQPAQSGAEVEAAVARGVKLAINGDLRDLRNHLQKLEAHLNRLDGHVGRIDEKFDINRDTNRRWHQENSNRLDRFERIVDSLSPWKPGMPDRRK